MSNRNTKNYKKLIGQKLEVAYLSESLPLSKKLTPETVKKWRELAAHRREERTRNKTILLLVVCITTAIGGSCYLLNKGKRQGQYKL